MPVEKVAKGLNLQARRRHLEAQFHEPVRPGDRLTTRQILRSVSDEKTTKLGTGRFWVIDVEYHNQRGDLVAVESYTGFGYRRAGEEAGK